MDLTNKVVVVLAVVMSESRQDLKDRLFLVQGGAGALEGADDESQFYGKWLARGPDSFQDALRRKFVERFATDDEMRDVVVVYDW